MRSPVLDSLRPDFGIYDDGDILKRTGKLAKAALAAAAIEDVFPCARMGFEALAAHLHQQVFKRPHMLYIPIPERLRHQGTFAAYHRCWV